VNVPAAQPRNTAVSTKVFSFILVT
jgi:hypothetical protein